MADQSICKIEGCGKSVLVLARGWCSMHYQRWQRHGDPLAGRTPPGVPARYFRDVVLAYDGEKCLTWPFSRSASGYGMLNSSQYVHRRVCEEVNGPPPSPKHEAAHECGQGLNGCVTKRHLSWKTHAENMADTIRHGTSTRGRIKNV